MTKPRKKLSKETQEVYDLALQTGGVEIHLDGPYARELRKSGLCDFGTPRGPNKKWVRMWPKSLPQEQRA